MQHFFSATIIGMLFLTGCTETKLNAPCTKDEQCGPGFDCHKQKCLKVCTKDEQCPEQMHCYKYHCLPGQKPNPKTQTTTSVDLPKQELIEKQALRREFELIRQNQIQIQDALKEIKNELKEMKAQRTP
ncbi:MAG: hypothetical protein QGI45_09345 [Myxococcota bacterium]|jgi:hypothetical protein|nr:hypothetical protein [Myxococcota bacterium]